MKYKTLAEAQKVLNFENQGRDYGTAIIEKIEDYYIIKII